MDQIGTKYGCFFFLSEKYLWSLRILIITRTYLDDFFLPFPKTGKIWILIQLKAEYKTYYSHIVSTGSYNYRNTFSIWSSEIRWHQKMWGKFIIFNFHFKNICFLKISLISQQQNLSTWNKAPQAEQTEICSG